MRLLLHDAYAFGKTGPGHGSRLPPHKKMPGGLVTLICRLGARQAYPEASPNRSDVCLLLEVEPIGLVRRKSGHVADGDMLT
jgi:hypothetical protein